MRQVGAVTKKKIVEESLQLFARKGYFSTSISDILRATGLTKGGLYSHFPSKEAIWYAVYDEAAAIWRSVVFEGVREIKDPLERVDKVICNVMENYLGGNIFDGGSFLVPMLVELSGQSDTMSRHILEGFNGFSKLLSSWLEEADKAGNIKSKLNYKEISDFLIISFNGAVTFYRATRDPIVWKSTMNQLREYVKSFKK